MWGTLWGSPFSTWDGKWGANPLAEGFSAAWGVLVCPSQQDFQPGWGGGWCGEEKQPRAGWEGFSQHLSAPDSSLQPQSCPWRNLLSLLWGKQLLLILITHYFLPGYIPSQALAHSSTPALLEIKTKPVFLIFLALTHKKCFGFRLLCLPWLKKKNLLASQWNLCLSVSASPPHAAKDALSAVCGALQGNRDNFQKGKPLFKISTYYPIT